MLYVCIPPLRSPFALRTAFLRGQTDFWELALADFARAAQGLEVTSEGEYTASKNHGSLIQPGRPRVFFHQFNLQAR